MSKFDYHWKRIERAISNGFLIETLKSIINSYRHLYWITRKDIRSFLVEDIAYKKLKKKYGYVLKNFITAEKEHIYSDVIWVCWLQGLEKAPILPKTCIGRMIDLFGEERVKIITADNFNKFIELPDYIITKWQKGIISHAHFSDVLRTCLLVKYGGTWIDSTVFILDDSIPDFFMNSSLFVFNNMKRGSVIKLSNWFISAYSNDQILNSVQKMLFEYWRKENGILHYFLFHLFFSMACETFKSEWDKVPKFSNVQPHILAGEIFNQYSDEKLEQIKTACCIQKLSNHKEIPEDISGTFYEKLIIQSRVSYQI